MNWILNKIATWGFNRMNKTNHICCEYCNTCGFASIQKKISIDRRKKFMRQ